MKIQTSKLKETLEMIRPGLATKEMIEQSTSFAFSEGSVVTFNDELCFRAPVEGLEELTGAVQAEQFYQIINRFTTDEVVVMIKGEELQLKAGKKRAGLKLATEIKLPFSEVEIPEKFTKLSEAFIKALKFCAPVCSKDMSSPILTAVHITAEGLESTDRYRIAQYAVKTNFKENVLLPGEYVRAICSISPTHFAISEGWIHFKNEDGIICSARLIEGAENFPKTSPLLNVDGVENVFPTDVIEALESAEVFGKADYEIDSQVDIIFKPGKMTMESSGEFGWYREVLPTEYKGEEMQFGVTPSLLRYILRQNLTFIKTSEALFFKTENWKYLTMLKRHTK